jgi:hypothetical protein
MAAALIVFVMILAVSALCCISWPVALSLPTVVFPGMLVAESLLREIESGTMESMLLTPADRGKLLWCKFAVRLRPMLIISVLLAAAGPVVGGLWGGLLGGGDAGRARDGAIAGMLIGGGCGAVAGAMLLGQSAAGGALAFHAVLVGRRRIPSYLWLIFYSGIIAVADGAIIIVGGLGAGLLAAVAAHAGGDAEGLIVFLIVSCVVFGLRTYLVGMKIPAWLVRRAAASFDRALLRGQ